MDGAAFCMSSSLADQHALHKDAYLIPLELLRADDSQIDLLEAGEPVRPNLSASAMHYLESIGLDGLEGSTRRAEAVWLHCLVIG